MYEVVREGWTRPLGDEPIQSVSSFSWPLYTSPRFNRELTKFMFSFRDESSTNRNINNLMFITGPELSGKSWFLRHNLEKFKGASVAKLLFHLDLKDTRSINFENFLDQFEGGLVKVMIQKCEEKFKEECFLTPVMIMDALFHNHDSSYLNIQLSSLLNKSLKSEDLIYIPPQQRQKLLNLMASIEVSPSKSRVIDKFLEIALILAENSTQPSPHKRQVEAALNLAMCFYIQEEINTCPEKTFTGLYRTGIKTTWFLLDLLNLIGGYHEMNIPYPDYPHVLVVLGK